MSLKKTKKAVAIAVSLSMIANLSPQVYANAVVTIPQNNSSATIPHYYSISQSHSTDLSFKSIKSKISDVLSFDADMMI